MIFTAVIPIDRPATEKAGGLWAYDCSPESLEMIAEVRAEPPGLVDVRRLGSRKRTLPNDSRPFTMNRHPFVSTPPEGSSVNLQGEVSGCRRSRQSLGSFSNRQRIQRDNRMPASFMVDTFVPGRVGLQPTWVRDGSRTRDRQFPKLMLYPLSYFVRCSFRTRGTEHGIPIAPSEENRAAGTPSADRSYQDTLSVQGFAGVRLFVCESEGGLARTHATRNHHRFSVPRSVARNFLARRQTRVR